MKNKGKRIKELMIRVERLEHEAEDRNSAKEAPSEVENPPGQPKRSEENDHDIRSSSGN